MPIVFFITFSVIFGLLTYKNFKLGTQIFILLLPTYLVRTKIWILPTTLLEIAFLVLFTIWIFKYLKEDLPGIRSFFWSNKYLAAFIIVFFVSSTISIFVSDMWWYSFGQWRAYFLEPLLLFIILVGRKEQIATNDLVLALAVSTVSITLMGIVQKFTGWSLPTEEWRNPETRRITSFFTSPNAVGLYLVPILLLTLYQFWDSRRRFVYICISILIFIALMFTKSFGAWAALYGAGLLFLFLIKQKRSVLILIFLSILPFFFKPVQSVFFSKQRSGSNRLQLWTYSYEYLTASPKNFIFGTGVRQFFRKIQKPHYEKEELERLIYPHNIFLNFWTEIGLLGMVGFIGMFYCLFKESLKTYKQELLVGASFLAMLTAILVHGMIDVPYFKNDLSMLFWVFAAVIMNNRKRI